MRRLAPGLLLLAACGGGGETSSLVSAEPSRLDFGPVAVGRAATLQFELNWKGSEPVVLETVVPDETLLGVVEATAFPSVLFPDAPESVTVAFRPTRNGLWAGDIGIYLDPELEPRPLLVPLTGTGLPNQITLRPSALDFGRVRIGETATATVTLVNAGSADLEVEALVFVPDSSLAFAARLDQRLALRPREEKPVRVSFSPVEVGLHRGGLAVAGARASTAPVEVELLGEAVTSRIALEPQDVGFEGVLVGESRRRTVVVRNLGFDGRRLEELVFLGSGPGFAWAGTVPAELPPGAQIELDVLYQPEQEGPSIAALELRMADGEVLQIPVTGEATGRATPRVRLEDHPLDFGAVTVGQDTERTVWVQVEPGPALPASQAGRIEPAGGPFSVEPTSEAVPGGQRVPLAVRFRPIALGPASAVLRVGSSTRAVTAEVVGASVGELALSVERLDFGRVPRGERAVRRVRVRSVGSAAVENLVARTDGAFGLEGAVPSRLERGEAFDLRVSYLERDAFEGRFSGQLVLEAPTGPSRVVLPLEASLRPLPLSTPELEVELEWQEAVDLDLHLALGDAPTFDTPGDACFCNAQPDWGPPGVEDDPWLDRDLGAGPALERIRLDQARAAAYRVEVVNGGTEAAEATVRVRVDGAPLRVRSQLVGPQSRWSVGSVRRQGVSVGFEDEWSPLSPELRTSCE